MIVSRGEVAAELPDAESVKGDVGTEPANGDCLVSDTLRRLLSTIVITLVPAVRVCVTSTGSPRNIGLRGW